MFADPQSITLSGAPVSLPRIGGGPSSGAYMASDGSVTLDISHSSGKRNRHVARLNNLKTAPDPLQPATNRPYSMSTYLVVDAPLFGYSNGALQVFVDGLVSWLSASSGANVTKLLGSES